MRRRGRGNEGQKETKSEGERQREWGKKQNIERVKEESGGWGEKETDRETERGEYGERKGRERWKVGRMERGRVINNYIDRRIDR